MQSVFRAIWFMLIVFLLLIRGELRAQSVDEGIALIGQGKLAEAKFVFEQVLKNDDKNAEAHCRLGWWIYLNPRSKDRDIDKAVDHMEEAVELNPSNADYQYKYGAALGLKTQNSGIIKQAILAPKVKKAFARAVELDPSHVQARIALAQYYLAAPSIMGGDEEEGWKQIDEAIKLDEVQGRSVKAALLARSKKNTEAEKEYKILIASKPEDWRVWKNYGYFHFGGQRYDEAIVCFQKYVKLRPDTADSYQSLAEALLKKGDMEQTLANLNKSLSIDKDYVPAIISLGEAYQAKGQKKEAREAYQRAISIAQNEYYRNQAEKKLKEVE